MEFYLDTSDVDAVKALARIFPLAGVTTNPSIVVAGNQTLEVLLPQLREAAGKQGRLFAQVVATTAEGVVSNARKLWAIVADIMVKVSVTAESLTAVKPLKEEGIPTLDTAVYDAAQGLLAVLASTEYVALCANHVDTQGGGGIRMVTDLQTLLKMHTSYAKMLATSFKTPRQALDCLLTGCESVTLSLDVTQQMISSPTADAAVMKFEHSW